MDFNEMQLPKVNERKQQSWEMRQDLGIKIRELIRDFQKERNYTFERYEIDSIFISEIKRSHDGYLFTKFGPDQL